MIAATLCVEASRKPVFRYRFPLLQACALAAVGCGCLRSCRSATAMAVLVFFLSLHQLYFMVVLVSWLTLHNAMAAVVLLRHSARRRRIRSLTHRPLFTPGWSLQEFAVIHGL